MNKLEERKEVLKDIQERRRDETGFTLIELMVVVLIMGILMAIAIPTFLSTRGSANDASAKSNATNAYTNEKSYYAANQTFETANASENGTALDDSLPWGATTTAVGVVEAYTVAVGSNCPTGASCVVVQASSKSANCFYIADIETSSSAIIAYYSDTGTAAAPCASVANTALPAAQPTGAYAGSEGKVLATAPAAGTWYGSW